MEQQTYSQIVATGSYLPPNRVTSRSLLDEAHSNRFDIADDWMDKHLGIIERRVADEGVNPSELAIEAAWVAIRKANISPTQIGLILYCGIDRDYIYPSPLKMRI